MHHIQINLFGTGESTNLLYLAYQRRDSNCQCSRCSFIRDFIAIMAHRSASRYRRSISIIRSQIVSILVIMHHVPILTLRIFPHRRQPVRSRFRPSAIAEHLVTLAATVWQASNDPGQSRAARAYPSVRIVRRKITSAVMAYFVHKPPLPLMLPR